MYVSSTNRLKIWPTLITKHGEYRLKTDTQNAHNRQVERSISAPEIPILMEKNDPSFSQPSLFLSSIFLLQINSVQCNYVFVYDWMIYAVLCLYVYVFFYSVYTRATVLKDQKLTINTHSARLRGMLLSCSSATAAVRGTAGDDQSAFIGRKKGVVNLPLSLSLTQSPRPR